MIEAPYLLAAHNDANSSLRWKVCITGGRDTFEISKITNMATISSTTISQMMLCVIYSTKKKHQITTDHLLTLSFWTTNNCFNMKYLDHTPHRNFVWTSHNTYDVNYVIYFNIIIPDVSCQCVKKVWNAILELQSSSILKIMFIISDTQSPSSCVSSGVSLYAVIIFHVWTIIYWCRKLVSFVSPLVSFLFCPCHVPTTTYYLKIYTKF